MSATPQSAHYTIDDLYHPDFDGRRIELWEGELHEEMPPAAYIHNRIIAFLTVKFMELEMRTPGVRLLPTGTGCLLEEDTMLIPDIGLHRVAPPTDSRGLLAGAPDLAVEVASPSNTATEFARKRRLYFGGGAEQVWIIHPFARRIEVFFRDGRQGVLTEGTLVGDGVAQGVTIELAVLFAEIHG